MSWKTWMKKTEWLAGLVLVLIIAAAARAQQADVFIQRGPEAGGRFIAGPDGALALDVTRVTDREFLIGVSCRPVDELLREHLSLDHGVVVDSVVAESPADKAGIKRNDILLQVGDKKLEKLDDLVAVVQDSGGKELSFHILRAGKEEAVKVAPTTPQRDFKTVTRDPLASEPLRLRVFNPGMVFPNNLIKEEPFPANLRISVVKEGNQPAQIDIKLGDESWSVTEEKLDELPEGVRRHVQRLLGRAHNFGLQFHSLLDREKKEGDKAAGQIEWKLFPGGELNFIPRPSPPAFKFRTAPAVPDFEAELDKLRQEMDKLREQLEEHFQREKAAADGQDDTGA